MEKEVKNTVKKNKKADIPTKNGKNYSYQYVDIAQIHEYLEGINAKYIQQIKRIENDDYVMTKRCFDDKWEEEWLQGSKVVDATLFGTDNPAQKQGSALTYARRYSLLMAFGLATEDDDAQSLNTVNEPTLEEAEKYVIGFGKYQGELLTEVIKDEWYKNYLLNGNDDYIKKCIELLTGEKALSESEQQESLKLLGELNRLFNETGIDRENMYKHYNVESDSQMTIEQMKDAIKKLKTKLNEQN